MFILLDIYMIFIAEIEGFSLKKGALILNALYHLSLVNAAYLPTLT